MSDQDGISRSPFYKVTITLQYRAEIVIRGLSVDPIPNSLAYHHRNCTADSKENY